MTLKNHLSPKVHQESNTPQYTDPNKLYKKIQKKNQRYLHIKERNQIINEMPTSEDERKELESKFKTSILNKGNTYKKKDNNRNELEMSKIQYEEPCFQIQSY